MVFMPFGKYKQKSLDEIPVGYLRWLLRECDLDAWLRAAVAAEVRRRGAGPDEDGHRPPGPADPSRSPAGKAAALVDVRSVVKRWFGEMSLTYHPDRGGSDAAMKAVNHAYERLRELLGC